MVRDGKIYFYAELCKYTRPHEQYLGYQWQPYGCKESQLHAVAVFQVMLVVPVLFACIAADTESTKGCPDASCRLGCSRRIHCGAALSNIATKKCEMGVVGKLCREGLLTSAFIKTHLLCNIGYGVNIHNACEPRYTKPDCGLGYMGRPAPNQRFSSAPCRQCLRLIWGCSRGQVLLVEELLKLSVLWLQLLVKPLWLLLCSLHSDRCARS